MRIGISYQLSNVSYSLPSGNAEIGFVLCSGAVCRALGAQAEACGYGKTFPDTAAKALEDSGIFSYTSLAEN